MSFTSFLIVVAFLIIATLVGKRAYDTFFAKKKREKAEKKNSGGTPLKDEKQSPPKK